VRLIVKVLAVLFFVFITPLVVFLTTILYGGISPSIINKELANAEVYQKISELINSAEVDEESKQFMEFFSNRLTPKYLQNKTEGAIEDSFNFVSGKSSIPPIVSFKELKDDIMATNPKLLASLEKIPEEIQKEQKQADGAELASDKSSAEISQSMESLNNLIKSDFTIKLDQYLMGLKNSYSVMKIVHPVLIVLLMGSIILLKLFSPSLHSFLKWAGVAFIVSGLLGFGIIFLSSIGLNAATNFAAENSNAALSIIAPIIFGILKNFLGVYKNYQTGASIGLLVLGALSIAGVALTKSQVAVSQSPKPSKKK
jgi:hypothetical protein